MESSRPLLLPTNSPLCLSNCAGVVVVGVAVVVVAVVADFCFGI